MYGIQVIGILFLASGALGGLPVFWSRNATISYEDCRKCTSEDNIYLMNNSDPDPDKSYCWNGTYTEELHPLKAFPAYVCGG